MFAPDTTVRRLLGRAVVLAALLLGVAIGAKEAAAQPTVTVSGNPPLMVVNSATAGLAPNAVSNSSTTCRVRRLGGGTGKVTARLNSPMPAGVTLSMTIAGANGSSSLGAVVLTTTSKDVITGITRNQTTAITYQLSATAAAGVVPAQSRSVTLTLIVVP